MIRHPFLVESVTDQETMRCSWRVSLVGISAASNSSSSSTV